MVIHGIPALLEARSLALNRRTKTLDVWIEGLVRSYRPALVAIVNGDAVRRHAGAALDPAKSADIELGEIAAALKIAEPTRAAICRELARRSPLIAEDLRSCAGIQTRAERYRQAATLAAGAALTMFSEFEKVPSP